MSEQLIDFGPILDGYRGWMERALCAQVDPELWFPEGGAGRDARRICASCSVVEQCAQYALDNKIREGIYGGLTGADRRQIWRERGISLADETEESA